MEKYELVKDIGSGNFGVARLMRNKATKELVVMKYIERGLEIDENIAREIINHRSLRHLNIIRFKELVLTPTHLAIVMEYAAGGELFERICNAGRFSEDEARYLFQQLISGVNYCHSMVKRIRREYVENSSGTGQELWQLLFSLPRIFTVMSTTVKALLLNWFLYWGRDSDEACGRWLRCVSFGLFGTKGNVGILRA